MTDFKNGDYLFRPAVSPNCGPFVYKVLDADEQMTRRIDTVSGEIDSFMQYILLPAPDYQPLRLATASEILAAKLMGL